MLRRSMSVLSSLFVALLLMGATSARASETLLISVNGIISVDGVNTVAVRATATKMSYTNAQGVVYRSMLSGSIIISGKIDGELITYNVPTTGAIYQNGWGTITAPTYYRGVPCQMELKMYPQVGTQLGVVAVRLLDAAGNVLCYPFSRRGTQTYTNFPVNGTASITYRLY